jgi:hypothetical protein
MVWEHKQPAPSLPGRLGNHCAVSGGRSDQIGRPTGHQGRQGLPGAAQRPQRRPDSFPPMPGRLSSLRSGRTSRGPDEANRTVKVRQTSRSFSKSHRRVPRRCPRRGTPHNAGLSCEQPCMSALPAEALIQSGHGINPSFIHTDGTPGGPPRDRVDDSSPGSRSGSGPLNRVTARFSPGSSLLRASALRWPRASCRP